MTDRFESLTPLGRLARDVRAASRSLGRDEGRYLVDAYYQRQKDRIALDAQVRAQHERGEPVEVLRHFAKQMSTLESQLRSVLDAWTDESVVSVWAKGQVGIGPIIAAGLEAHIDITRAPTAGSIWRYAGLDPTAVWIGREQARSAALEAIGSGRLPTYLTLDQLHTLGKALGFTDGAAEVLRKFERELTRTSDDERVLAISDDGEYRTQVVLRGLTRRPWNADLKTLYWKIGDSFVKTQSRANAFYGLLYKERKLSEVIRNESGGNAAAAEETLRTRNITDMKTRQTYEGGRLPDGRVDLRARRWTVKLFLSHWHAVAYRAHHKVNPPKPYVIEHMGHTDMIVPPHWPWPEEPLA